MRRNRKFIYGVFNHPDDILNAAYAVRSTRNEVLDCFTPFAVHGLDRAIGVKRSRLGIVAFLMGLTGFLCAVSLQYYTNVFDWPMNIGGKPAQLAVPSFVPVCFELTVLCTAYGMGITFFLRARTIFGVRATVLEPRQSDDQFIMCFDMENKNLNVAEVTSIMKSNGALEVKQAEMMAGAK
jgi:hypothetical protein